MRRAITLLALLIFAMNASLWANGEFSNTQFSSAYPNMPSGLQDINDVNQNALVMLDASGNPINSSSDSFLATQFDFADPIAIVGSLATLANFAIGLIINLTFGITLLAIKFQAPMNILVFLGALNFVIAAIGLMEIVAFINSVIRGGGAN